MKKIFKFLLGATLGAIVALLFTPKSGEELRTDIRSMAKKELSSLGFEWQKVIGKINEGSQKVEANLHQDINKRKNSEMNPDDLTKIEGIGPKVSALLISKDIKTYAQLAEANIPWIKTLLKEAGYGFMNPSSWKDQAKLASQGDWEELEKLQNTL